VHVYKKRTTSGKKVIQRDSFRLGVLSPNCRSTHNEGLGVNDPSALLLSSDSVMYPFLDRVSRCNVYIVLLIDSSPF
jgi:hypothetical protein